MASSGLLTNNSSTTTNTRDILSNGYTSEVFRPDFIITDDSTKVISIIVSGSSLLIER